MSEESTSKVEVPNSGPDVTKDAQRTPTTDTRPPEEKEDDDHSAEEETTSNHDWSYSEPPPSLVSRIQLALGAQGYYDGPADGLFDRKSRQAVQRAIKTVGYEGSANGHIGEKQVSLIQTFAQKHGSYSGAIDKHVDDVTWAGFLVGLESL